MSSLSSGNVMPKGIRILLLGLLITALFIIVSPFNSDASREAVDFYSLKSPPPGINSLEALIARWWNWWENHPSDTAHHWPVCLKQDGNVGNQSVVFLANPAYSDQANANSMNQRCEISSNQLVYMTLYPGECSAFDSPEVYHNSTANLLDCAIKSNLVIKLNRVVVDGKDVSSNIIRQQISHPFNFIIPKVNVDDANPTPVGMLNPSMAENYYMFFKPMPIGSHTIEADIIRQPVEANQPVEQHHTKWNINVTP